jgi:DNA-cytosine methyltransferase
MKHASFFSGVGGLDLGFERAGIETVSVSEIDPYANAVLAERFPSAINLGSITEVNAHEIPEADIWSGGFPCQDLSVAGKRAGFAGRRSSLAFTFIDLMAERKPQWVVLENVPGLFTSNKGADFGRLLYEMERIGYGVSWRILDARHFGIAQRRRRVFIVASLESDRAAQVLFECEGGCGHLEASESPWQNPAPGAARGVAGSGDGIGEHATGEAVDANRMRTADGVARWLDNSAQLETQRVGNFELYDFPKDAIAPSMNAKRAADLLAYVINDTRPVMKGENGKGYSTEDIAYTLTAVDQPGVMLRADFEVADTLTAPTGGGRRDKIPMTVSETVLSFPSRFGANAQVTEGQAQSFAHSAGAPAVFRKAARARTDEDSETWVEGEVANTLNGFDVGDTRTTHAILGGTEEPDDLLPIGLDSHRYRTCGNGVVAPVAEWIGRRIVEVNRRWAGEGTNV